jgi:hypothetical protein
MRRRNFPIRILAVSLAAGLTFIAYNIAIFTQLEPDSKARFAYFAAGVVVILSGWYIYSLLTRIEQLRMDQDELNADYLARIEQLRVDQDKLNAEYLAVKYKMERLEMERFDVQQDGAIIRHKSPRICRMEKPRELPTLTPEQLYIMQNLFRDDYQIHVDRLSGGYSNHGVFKIVQERRRGDELDTSGFVLKYLDVKDVRDEIRVHREGGLLDQYPLAYTPGKLIHNWPAGDEIAVAPDDLLGAVYYHLTTLEKGSQLQTLTDIYNDKPFEGIEPYLVSLFDERLLPWYRQSRDGVVAKPLGGANGEYERLYNKRERIQECVSDLLSIPHRELSNIDRIDIPFLPEPWGMRAFHNPVSWILNVLVPGTAGCFRATCYYSPVHGDLHTGNILVEQGRHTHIWLIDFPHAHVGPALIDLATLEADVKYNLLSEEHCSMEEWLGFEGKLLAPLEKPRQIAFLAPWYEDWKPENQHLRKAWRFIGFLRDRVISSSLMGADVRAYYLALLHATLPVVYRQHSEFQKRCALVSSAWMCEYLGPKQ